jgi:hypothetical protein
MMFHRLSTFVLVAASAVGPATGARGARSRDVSEDRKLHSKKDKCKNIDFPIKADMSCCPCVSEENCLGFTYSDSDEFYFKLYNYGREAGGRCTPTDEDSIWFYDEFICAYDPNNDMKIEESYNPDALNFRRACDGVGCGGRRRTLNEVKDDKPHYRRVTENPDKSRSVQVNTYDLERLEWLKEHITKMEALVNNNNGDSVPRSWDPLFAAFFENLENIDLACEPDAVLCTSSGHTECGKDLVDALMSYHEEIANSIQEKGTHVIMESHAIPDSCL